MDRKGLSRRSFVTVATSGLGAVLAACATRPPGPIPTIAADPTATTPESAPTAAPEQPAAPAATAVPTARAEAATQDEAEIENKTRNPPALAVDDGEPPESSFPIPVPIFIPPQTLVRRWRVNTVERDVSIDLKDYTLTIDGLVERPITLTYDELLKLPQHTQTTDLHCVEGWGVYDIRWEGVHLSTLFEAVGVRPEATHASFFTFPKIYSDSLSLDQAFLPDTMIAYRANDQPLKVDHGWPLRLVVPSMYGYKSVKWLDRIELAPKRHIGYWEQRGWRPDPWIR